jgi:hypothetical protein
MLAVGLQIRTTEDQDATTIVGAKAVLGIGTASASANPNLGR